MSIAAGIIYAISASITGSLCPLELLGGKAGSRGYLLLIVAGLLFLVLVGLPIGYYIFLKIIVTTAAVSFLIKPFTLNKHKIDG